MVYGIWCALNEPSAACDLPHAHRVNHSSHRYKGTHEKKFFLPKILLVLLILFNLAEILNIKERKRERKKRTR
jgi:hypothetical protein